MTAYDWLSTLADDSMKYIAAGRTATVYSAEAAAGGGVIAVKQYNRLGRDGGTCDVERWAYKVTNEGSGPGKR